MLSVVLLSVLLNIVASSPIAITEDDSKVTFALAVDISSTISTQTFSCLKSVGYQTAFIRIYSKAGGTDPNGAPTMFNAISAGLGAEAYIEPQTSNGNSGAQQFDDAVNYVTSRGINLRSAWLQVTGPINWPKDAQANRNFIQSFIDRAQAKNMGFGIYTSAYDWQQITNGWTDVAGFVNLWYWHVTGVGQDGATPANFNDFVPFGPWSRPTVKQFGQGIPNNACSITTNMDTYVLSAKAKSLEAREQKTELEKDGKFVVGNLMMTQ